MSHFSEYKVRVLFTNKDLGREETEEKEVGLMKSNIKSAF